MTTERDHEITAEPRSKDYGNSKVIGDVFEEPTRPMPTELVDALHDTGLLTEKEASAFVYKEIECQPINVGGEVTIPHEFENICEFNSCLRHARETVGQAIWIYELIDAYRFPDFPEECTECGRSLGGTWVELSEEPGFFCRECGDLDADPLGPPGDSENY